MDKNLLGYLKRTFLFTNIPEEDIASLIKNTKIKTEHFAKGEVIYSPTHFGKMLGFIVEGECEVQRLDTDTPLPLNTLTESSSFGALAVFSKSNSFPTHIVAKKSARVLFIHKEDIDELILKSPRISQNVISFLAKKIEFLNEKIATFSQSSVASKLAKHLLIESEAKNTDTVSLNCKRISEKLNVGRASIYRALDTLIQSGLVKSDKKQLIIIDRKGLERI